MFFGRKNSKRSTSSVVLVHTRTGEYNTRMPAVRPAVPTLKYFKVLVHVATVKCQIIVHFGTLIDRFIPSRRGSKVFLFGPTFIYKISTYGINILVYGYPGLCTYITLYAYTGIYTYIYLVPDTSIYTGTYINLVPVHVRIYI